MRVRSFILFYLLCSGALFAESSVSFHLQDTDSTPGYDSIYVWAGNDGTDFTNKLISNDQSDENATATIYMPIITTASTASISQYNRLATQTPDETTGAQLRIKLLITNNSGKITRLWAAYKGDDGSYKTFQDLSESISSPTTRVSYTETLILHDGTKCFNGLDSCLDSKSDVTYELYIFQVDTDVSGSYYNDKTIDPSSETYSEGATISLVMGEPTFDPFSVSFSITAVVKGDERLYLVYTSNYEKDNYYYKHLIFDYNGGANTFDNVSGSYLKSMSGSSSGTLTVNKLVNDQDYHLHVAAMDKFQFVTQVSDRGAGAPHQPKDIGAFLEEEGCYVLSSGFTRSHYVIDYFKKIRDEILMKSSIGRRFVNLYYRTAPKYTALIYSNPFIGGVVRAASFSIYYIFNYWVLASLFLVFLLINMFFIFKKRSFAC